MAVRARTKSVRQEESERESNNYFFRQSNVVLVFCLRAQQAQQTESRRLKFENQLSSHLLCSSLLCSSRLTFSSVCLAIALSHSLSVRSIRGGHQRGCTEYMLFNALQSLYVCCTGAFSQSHFYSSIKLFSMNLDTYLSLQTPPNCTGRLAL